MGRIRRKRTRRELSSLEEAADRDAGQEQPGEHDDHVPLGVSTTRTGRVAQERPDEVAEHWSGGENGGDQGCAGGS